MICLGLLQYPNEWLDRGGDGVAPSILWLHDWQAGLVDSVALGQAGLQLGSGLGQVETELVNNTGERDPRQLHR